MKGGGKPPFLLFGACIFTGVETFFLIA